MSSGFGQAWLYANAKTREGGAHPARDGQFGHINGQVAEFLAAGEPVIDTRKKELIGDFKNAGRQWRPKGRPEEVKVHDFADKEFGKAAPYGDVAHNIGWSAMTRRRLRWKAPGAGGGASGAAPGRLLITADCSGSNGVRLWKVELQKLARELGLEIMVCRPAPANGTAHRLFSFISQNWRGKPLRSLAAIVSLISATTTEAGLKVYYPKGIKDAEIKALDIRCAKFQGEWNYSLLPTPDTDAVVS